MEFTHEPGLIEKLVSFALFIGLAAVLVYLVWVLI